MLALVLSGAGNFGPMQVGALEVLLEEGFHPEIIVGTSAGALNAVFFASDPTPTGLNRLVDAWRSVGETEVGMPSLFSGVRRLITMQDGLIDSHSLAELLREKLPVGLETFGQLAAEQGVRAYTVAICMETGRLVVFGDHEDDRVLDGMMASAAIPPYFPPWERGGRHYVDGGVLSKLPVRVAFERGATEVVAIDIRNTHGTLEGARGMIGIGSYSLSLIMEHQTETEIEWVTAAGIPIYRIRLAVPSDMQFWDFSQPDRLISRGRELAQSKLDSEPLSLHPTWWLWFSRASAGLRSRRTGTLSELES